MDRRMRRDWNHAFAEKTDLHDIVDNRLCCKSENCERVNWASRLAKDESEDLSP
jgi:hypothetical protein